MPLPGVMQACRKHTITHGHNNPLCQHRCRLLLRIFVTPPGLTQRFSVRQVENIELPIIHLDSVKFSSGKSLTL